MAWSVCQPMGCIVDRHAQWIESFPTGTWRGMRRLQESKEQRESISCYCDEAVIFAMWLRESRKNIWGTRCSPVSVGRQVQWWTGLITTAPPCSRQGKRKSNRRTRRVVQLWKRSSAAESDQIFWMPSDYRARTFVFMFCFLKSLLPWSDLIQQTLS